MRKLISILAVGVLTLLSACENSDWSFDDYDYTTVYFAYQSPIRTLVMGNDEEFNNDLDNEHKCLIKATLGGVYDNGTNRTIDISVANSLCDNLYFGTGEKVMPMPAEYYNLASNQIVIPKGELSGGVEVQFTDAFFADPLSTKTTYVIPLVMNNVHNADSILCGDPRVENPDRLQPDDWNTLPKDYILYAVKYVNPWDGMLIRRGIDKVTTGGTTSTVVRHEKYIEDDEIVEFSTRNLRAAEWQLTLNGQACNILLTFNDNDECTLSSDTQGVTVSGSGKWVEKGEKNSFNGKDRDALYLDYTVNVGGTQYATLDTLVMRDRQVKAEWFTVTKQ